MKTREYDMGNLHLKLEPSLTVTSGVDNDAKHYYVGNVVELKISKKRAIGNHLTDASAIDPGYRVVGRIDRLDKHTMTISDVSGADFVAPLGDLTLTIDYEDLQNITDDIKGGVDSFGASPFADFSLDL